MDVSAVRSVGDVTVLSVDLTRPPQCKNCMRMYPFLKRVTVPAHSITLHLSWNTRAPRGSHLLQDLKTGLIQDLIYREAGAALSSLISGVNLPLIGNDESGVRGPLQHCKQLAFKHCRDPLWADFSLFPV